MYTPHTLLLYSKSRVYRGILIFIIFAHNIDCGYELEPPRRGGSNGRGGSNEYPQSMFWSKNKKKQVYPSIPQVCYIKVGYKGVYIAQTYFHDAFV